MVLLSVRFNSFQLKSGRGYVKMANYVFIFLFLLSFPSQCCGDSKWGDWRPHLAVILSNHVGEAELNHRAIVTMGDTLGEQRQILSPDQKSTCSIQLCSQI